MFNFFDTAQSWIFLAVITKNTVLWLFIENIGGYQSSKILFCEFEISVFCDSLVSSGRLWEMKKKKIDPTQALILFELSTGWLYNIKKPRGHTGDFLSRNYFIALLSAARATEKSRYWVRAFTWHCTDILWKRRNKLPDKKLLIYTLFHPSTSIKTNRVYCDYAIIVETFKRYTFVFYLLFYAAKLIYAENKYWI